MKECEFCIKEAVTRCCVCGKWLCEEHKSHEAKHIALKGGQVGVRAAGWLWKTLWNITKPLG